MSDRRRVRSDPKRGICKMSIAAQEAFNFLNAGTRFHYRGRGDTSTAARERAAERAGITPAQAERIWKRWDQMKTVNGDVYRALRNTYGHLCEMVEHAADAVEAKQQEIEATHETSESPAPASKGTDGAIRRDVAKTAGKEMR